MILTGFPLEDLHAVTEYFDGLTYVELIWLTRSEPEDGGVRARAFGEVTAGIDAGWQLLSTLTLAYLAPGPARYWEEVQRRCDEARSNWLDDWLPGTPMSEFRTAMEFVFTLDRRMIDEMAEGPTPELDRAIVIESVARLRDLFDQYERGVHRRGNWPR